MNANKYLFTKANTIKYFFSTNIRGIPSEIYNHRLFVNHFIKYYCDFDDLIEKWSLKKSLPIAVKRFYYHSIVFGIFIPGALLKVKTTNFYWIKKSLRLKMKTKNNEIDSITSITIANNRSKVITIRMKSRSNKNRLFFILITHN